MRLWPRSRHVRPLRVLVLDDEDSLRGALARVLRQGGLNVEETGDPHAALERLTRPDLPPVDVVVCDVVMPLMNGIVFGERMRERGVEASLVYISGLAEESALRDWGIPSTTPFLAKPFQPSELMDAVTDAAGGARHRGRAGGPT